MKATLILCAAAVSFSTLCHAAECGFPAAVTASLVCDVGTNTFDFGHDLAGNPINPLPDGGSLILSGIGVRYYIEWGTWYLGFDFSSPSARTTTLEYTVYSHSNGDVPAGADSFYLGLTNAPDDPIASQYANYSGSHFLISETILDRNGRSNSDSICEGGNFQGCTSPKLLGGYNVYYPQGVSALQVTTTITDYAGDLTGFNQAFSTPEPATAFLLLGGLLSLAAFRRRA